MGRIKVVGWSHELPTLFFGVHSVVIFRILLFRIGQAVQTVGPNIVILLERLESKHWWFSIAMCRRVEKLQLRSSSHFWSLMALEIKWAWIWQVCLDIFGENRVIEKTEARLWREGSGSFCVLIILNESFHTLIVVILNHLFLWLA